MTTTAPIVTIVGGSGFIGRYVAQRMARRGWRVRVACRRPNEALFVKPYGVVGQVEPVQCNIRDEASMRRVISGATAVVNCVGLLWQTGPNTFETCQAEGAGRVARIAAEEGVASLVHVSAIGADAASASDYARTKAEGEAAVQAAFPGAVILRPSIVFGPEDGFFNQFAKIATLSPIIPVIGAETKFQPVWVEDVAEAAALGADGTAKAGIYELGGPEVLSFRTCMERMLSVVKRRRLVVNVPFFIARVQASVLQLSAVLGIQPVLTRDQVRLLAHDNVVSEGASGLDALGIDPTGVDAILESYLYAYRRFGQYTALSSAASKVRS